MLCAPRGCCDGNRGSGALSALCRRLQWLVLPLGLMMCVAAGGVFVKRKRNKDAAHEQSTIGMTHVYEDVNNAELQQKKDPTEKQPPALIFMIYYKL
ncbi:unnamed protein product [Pleuronectes platessa]|uniref:Uncharacterized protein n=1 Tax=Pleuronectes platessa TaxID=8262 RepID=A0A9N7Y3I1_PLEPL|nr:unnamed protein product [Pleuronectes platessa]